MTVQRLAAAACGAAFVFAAMSSPSARTADSVKLSGCLVQGHDDEGYLLINGPSEPAIGAAPATTASPGAVGTTGVVANIFYWLDKDGDLKPHIGHRVEIDGDLKGNLKDGEIKIDRKEQWTEIEVKSDGRKMKARVPNTSIVEGPDSDRKVNVLVRRVDVSKVRMLDATCR